MDLNANKIVAFDGEKEVGIKRGFKKISLNVKPLYISHLPLFCLNANEVLEKEITVPLVRGQDFKTTLFFLAESHLPYPLEEAIVEYHIIKKERKQCKVLLFFIRKERLNELIPKEKSPHAVTCTQAALGALGRYFVFPDNRGLILHLERTGCTLALIERGVLIKSSSSEANPKGIERLFLYFKAKIEDLPATIFITGKLAKNDAFKKEVEEILKQPLLDPILKKGMTLDVQEVQTFAPLIGAAVSFLPNAKFQINFLRGKYVFTWLKSQIYLFIFLSALCAFGFFTLFSEIFAQEEKKLETRTLSYLNQKAELLSAKAGLTYFPYSLDCTVPKVTNVMQLIQKKALCEGIQIEKIKYSMHKYPSKAYPKQEYKACVEIEFKGDAKSFAENFADQTEYNLKELAQGHYKIYFII